MTTILIAVSAVLILGAAAILRTLIRAATIECPHAKRLAYRRAPKVPGM